MSEEVKEVVEEVKEEAVEEVTDVPEVVTEEVEEVAPEVVEEEIAPKTLDELYELAFSPQEEPAEEVVEEVIEEITEESTEPELPEYTKLIEGEIDLTSELEVEAINYWGGGPKAEWTKHPENFTPEQKAVFAKHQSAHDKSRVRPVAEVGTRKHEMDEAVNDLYKLIKGDPETKKKYTKEEITETVEAPRDDTEKLGKMFDAIDSGEREAAMKIFAEIRKEDRERAVADAAKLAREAALQGVQENQSRAEYEGWINSVAEENRRLEERDGSAYTQYKPQIQRFLELTEQGIPNPVTGKLMKSVEEAYALALKLDTGGERRVASVRPSTVVVPPAGSGEGSAPKFTDEDMAGDTRSFMEKAWDEVHK